MCLELVTTIIHHINQPLSSRQDQFVLMWYPAFESLSLVVLGYSITSLSYRFIAVIYTKIIDQMLLTWANNPPSKSRIALSVGNVRWEFGCLVHPVPQAFLEQYFKLKYDGLRKGFAPILAKEWYWYKGDGSRQCYAGMRVVDERSRSTAPPRKGSNSL